MTELIDKQSSIGYTPLHYAARMGSLEAAKLFVEKGAKLNLTEF